MIWILGEVVEMLAEIQESSTCLILTPCGEISGFGYIIVTIMIIIFLLLVIRKKR